MKPMAEAMAMDQPVQPEPDDPPEDQRTRLARQRRRARYTTALLVVIVLVLYFGFIAYSVLKSLHGHH
ncbi:MAG TPA: hypothetical protein VKT19_03025 [Steroidobacteraceae bacterium]|nr:hypothetical protein [Steroidobacteraceae bacterium]